MKDRIVILADKKLGPVTSKMGNSAIRFAGEKIVAVIDRSKAGKVVQDVLGFGGDIPIHASLEETLAYEPNALLIGISPPGGALPSDWYSWIIEALQNKLNIISGLHEHLSDIAEFKLLADKYKVKIKDLRKYDGHDILAKGLAKNFRSKTVLTVGTHGNSGKMTATILMVKALQEMGRSAEWFATGQIGIFLQKRGIPLDAIKGDFISGILEHHLAKIDGNYEFLFVEGQGSLFHMAYSPVSLGIIHGCLPDAMILCHRPDIGVNDYGVDTGNLRKAIEINNAVASIAKPSKITGIALNTYNLSKEKSHQIIDETAKSTGLPTTDPVRFGSDVLVGSLIKHFDSK
jgi:D-glutamate N-acetyltransferase